MARTFVRASSQYLEAAGAVFPGVLTAYTFAAWYRPSSIANGTVIGLGDSDSTSYIAVGMNATGNAFVEHNGAAGASGSTSAGAITSGVWAHICATQSSAASRVVYLNGTAATVDTTSNALNAGIMDRVTAGGLVINGARVSFAGGDIARIGIWDSALTAGQVASLATGVLPSTIPTGLLDYWEIDGSSSPEPDLGSNNFSLTVVGATLAGSNPPSGSGSGFLVLPPPVIAGPSYAARRAASF